MHYYAHKLLSTTSVLFDARVSVLLLTEIHTTLLLAIVIHSTHHQHCRRSSFGRVHPIHCTALLDLRALGLILSSKTRGYQ